MNRVTFLANVIDLSPTYTGVVMGVISTFCVMAGIGAPLITGLLTNGNPTPENYRKVFFVNAAVCAIGALFFSVFGSGDVQ